MSIINEAIESVMDLIDEMNLFSRITRGALGTGPGLVCEISPTMPGVVFMDKNSYTPIDLTLNGKHHNLQILSDAMNDIHDNLTRRREYPNGDKWEGSEWEIVDITTGSLPQKIGREDDGQWLMASSLIIKLYRKDEEQNERELGE